MSAQPNVSPVEQSSDSSLFAGPHLFNELEANSSFEYGADENGRLNRLGSFIMGMPPVINESIEKTVISFRHDTAHSIKRTVQGAIIAGEASLINEALRYGALTYMLSNTSGGWVIGGATLGLTTFAVEASAALATAGLITTGKSDRMLTKINEKIEKYLPNNFEMNPGVEAGVAMIGGSAVVVAEKQREDQTRTVAENRKHGLFTAGWMSAYFTVEGAFIGANSYGDVLNAKTIGATALATGLTWAGVDVCTRGMRRAKNTEAYSSGRNLDDQAIRVGIFQDDLGDAIRNRGTIFAKVKSLEGGRARLPVLVPACDLEWYNNELIGKKYGKDAKILCYVHPPIYDEDSSSKIEHILRKKLSEGYVIVTDKYVDDTTSPIAKIVDEAKSKSGEFSIECFGGDTESSRVDVFAGHVSVEGSNGEIFEAPSLYEVYRRAIESGDLQESQENGVSLQEVVDGDEAEALWEIYKKPFEDLGRDDPTHAGFDKEGLLGLLKDPEVTKIINRVDGEITTLCFFLHNFDKAPWFNADYYKNNYPEYYETGNILMFPGIVSDENKRGNNYAMDVIDMASQLGSKRGSGVLVTFECTEVSTTYIPEIVTAAIGNSGVVSVAGLDRPVSQIEYFAIVKN